MNMLVVDRLSRTFTNGAQKIHALRDVSFTVADREIIGLLGPNGAGKTTLTKIAATLLLPTTGTVLVEGLDVVARPAEARRLTSVVLGGDRGLYPRLSGRDNLRFFAMLHGATRRELAARADAALAEAGLAAAAGHNVETYSRGMRQRLHLAIGLFTRPRLLLLDEPTVGLDPIEADRIRSVVSDLRAAGAAVLLTSHYLLDIERLADRVVLLDEGKLTGDMPVARFARTAGYVSTVTVRVRGAPPADLSAAPVRDGLAVDGVWPEGDLWAVRLRVRDWQAESFRDLSELIGAMSRDLEIVDVSVEPLRLEDAYVRLHDDSTEPH